MPQERNGNGKLLTAGLWMAALRGARNNDTETLALCFTGLGDMSAIPCVEEWLDARPDRRVTIAVGRTPSSEAFVEWARARRDQVRIVKLPGP